MRKRILIRRLNYTTSYDIGLGSHKLLVRENFGLTPFWFIEGVIDIRRMGKYDAQWRYRRFISSVEPSVADICLPYVCFGDNS
jgi:hypothetical protein